MVDVYLPLESQKRLIGIARQTLESVVRGCSGRFIPHDDPYLEESGHGAFVSLFNQDELRGCVGTCTPSNSLRDIVVDMTKAASSRDPRVKPIRSEELERIHIDISVVSQLATTPAPLSLAVGCHGLHISHGRNRAVLLPQVAVKHGWDMRRFLEATCIKADLPKDAWRWADTVVSSFTALIIEEEQ